MANYQIKLVLRPEMVLRSSSYSKSKVTYSAATDRSCTACIVSVTNVSGKKWRVTCDSDANHEDCKVVLLTELSSQLDVR